jgi:hypothetical protein
MILVGLSHVISTKTFSFGADGESHYKFQLSRNEVIDVDGRTHYFWNLQETNFRYEYTGSLGKYININIGASPQIMSYTQYYTYELYDGSNLTIEGDTSYEVTEDKFNDSFVIRIGFIISQTGGLYIILVVIVNFILKPFARKVFLHDLVNSVIKVNKINEVNAKKEAIKREDRSKLYQLPEGDTVSNNIDNV